MRETSSVESGKTTSLDGLFRRSRRTHKKKISAVKNGREAEEFLEFANEARIHRAQLRRTWNYSENSGRAQRQVMRERGVC